MNTVISTKWTCFNVFKFWVRCILYIICVSNAPNISTVNWQTQGFKAEVHKPNGYLLRARSVFFLIFLKKNHHSSMCYAIFLVKRLHMHSSIIHLRVSVLLIDWMIECALGTCIYDPAVSVERRAVVLSCDEAKSPGTHGGPCLSISVTLAWVFLPDRSVSHTAAQHTDIAWTSLSQALLFHFGTHESIGKGPLRKEDPPLYLASGMLEYFSSGVIWMNVCRARCVRLSRRKWCIHIIIYSHV